MATPTKYPFTKEMDIPSLVIQIQNSSIITVLDHIESVEDEIDIWFRDVLSTDDVTTLNAVVDNYAFISPPAPPPSEVVTQYEKNDKDLKLAKAKASIGEDCTATVSVKIPGDFLTGPGRWIAGGYGFSEDYNKDDYITCWVEDTDRQMAMMVALGMDPAATSPVDDSVIQGMGIVPGIGVAFPQYPIIKTYTDDELPSENMGWFFWPTALGNNLSPIGECEVEPIAGYGHIPSGLYLILKYWRPEGITTGGIRVDFFWGKKE